jgi:hypothetical protein
MKDKELHPAIKNFARWGNARKIGWLFVGN